MAGEYALELNRIYDILAEKMSNNDNVTMDEIEESFREAALNCGRIALSKFLTEMDEEAPICPSCVEKMRNHGKREKQIVTLLGSCEYSRNYYGCECGEHAIPKDEMLVVIGDGAKWIWNLAEDNFPGATQIIDLYHAKEHVFDLLRTVIPNETELYAQKHSLYKMLENGNIDGLVKRFSEFPANTEEQSEKIRIESNYFMRNKERMQYQDFSRQGFFVGSGVVEAACKNVIGKRLKQSGMMWSVAGANKIAALRCAVMSGEFEPKSKETA